MSIETTSWFITLFYLLVSGTALVAGIYFIYWLLIELPVLIKIKHEELYDYWKYPNASAGKSKPTLWRRN
tara:strand:+ start:269 stop:478 length:210 start_codon:yes stop_codon:yes gene_type:complete